MEFVTAIIIEPLVNIVMLPITDRLRYMMFCRKYVRDMRSKMRELEVTRVDVEDHMNRNTRSRLEIPSQVRGWLDEVEGINANVQNFPSDAIGCFNLNIRHKLGRKALKITDEIESFTRQNSLITWTDRPIPLGKIDSMKASTSTPSSDHRDFQSREETFTEALKALEPNNNSHMIALCGMGGVGKTTMMQRLKKVVQEKKMFNFFVEAVIGEKTEPTAIQEAVANYLGIELKETTKPARAEKLRNWFNDNLVGGKKKLLVILDDVWEFVDLNDIGLSPLPNQGVDFKVLLTSRNKDICIRLGVEANSILNVKGLIETEAQSFFRQFLQISDDVDNELHKIGEDIVRKCYGLPIAIKTIAYTLKGGGKHVWEDALARLQHRDIYDVVNEVFEISYNNLQDQESKAIFLLCGLFPEDYNIPIEDLVRYGWGLKLFNRVHTITEARNRLNTCIDRLIHKNLLMETRFVGRVKMHDLALTFVLNMYSKVEHAVIVNHGSRPGWPEENDVSNSCERISLTCKGMTEIPSYLKFPHLSILKVMHGDKSLRFPENFYGEMEKVQVISYYNLRYPLLPSSLHCSPNLRVLHLHQCSLMIFDCSSIGNLSNLEVLSFAGSSIKLLPSTIGNLEKLRLLDLTDCDGLRVEKGALKNLMKLEELYMIVSEPYRTSSNFTDDNCNEIAERLENLSSLEFELFGNNAQPKNMSFAKLERFKISVGRSFDGSYGKSKHSFGNMLQLVTNKDEVLDSGLNDLFVKTEVLCLSVKDMNDLGDVEVKSSHLHQSCSFQNLRVFVVSKCVELRYLFTLGVANSLSKLEHLEVYECDNMEEVIHTGGCGEATIIFPKMKFLCLGKLPKLLGFCRDVGQIQLPQLVELKLDNIPGFTSIYPKNNQETSSLLKEEVVLPNLEKLHINHMEDLKEIWPCEFGASDDVNVSMMRRIEVMNCDSLVNLFPWNPMSLIHHLEELEVRVCGSIEVLFNIDLDSVGETGEGSNLRSIEMYNLSELREVWRIKGAESCLPIHGFEAVKSIKIEKCRSFRNIFTPITANFDLGALMKITIQDVGEEEEDELVESSQEGEITILSKEEEISQIRDSISNIVFPSCLIHSFHNLRKIEMSNYEGMEVVFEIESPRSRELVTTHDNQQKILPNLEDLKIRDMQNINHVWKCNWNNFINLQKKPLESPFHNLTTIQMEICKSIKYLFSPLMAKLLSNLKKIKIESCDGIEEVVSNKDDEDEENTTSTSTSTRTSCTNLFPHLVSLFLNSLPHLKCIGGGGCANSEKNKLYLKSFTGTTPFVDQFKFSSEVGGVSWSLCQYAKEITIEGCHALSSVIPCYAVGQMQKLQVLKIVYCQGMKEVFETQGMSGCDIQREIPRPNDVIILKLPNLKELCISNCDLLEHVFSFSALESLGKLEELKIGNCYGMKVIVKEEEPTSSKEVVVFPCLKSIKLHNLPNLKCIGGGDCANGGNNNLSLNNSTTTTPFVDQYKFSSEAGGVSWSLCQYAKEIRIEGCHALSSVIPCYAVGQMQKLQVLKIVYCQGMKEVFETQGMSGCDIQHEIPRPNDVIILKLPNLKELCISNCDLLEHVFPFSALGSLGKLEELKIWNCYGMKVIVKEEEPTSSKEVVVFPCLKSIKLHNLPNLKCIGGGDCANSGNNNLSLNNSTTTIPFVDQYKFSSAAGGVSWSLCQYAKEIRITWCGALSSVIPCYVAGQMQKLQVLHIEYCQGMKEVFETQGMSGCYIQQAIPRPNDVIMLKLPNLKILEIFFCDGLEHVFPFSALESLGKLEELSIWNCKAMKVIVKEEEASSKEVVVFPCLKSIELHALPNLKGFFLGMNKFQWPSLDKVTINNCPEMMVFAPGGSTTPHLKYVHTTLGKYSAEECGLNFHAHVTDTAHHQTPLFPSLDGSSSCPATSEERRPWSFHNLIELNVEFDYDVQKIIPSNELLNLQKLEEIHVRSCRGVDEVFEEAGRNSSTDESQTTTTTTLVTLPNLKEIELVYLPCLRYMWKSNQWTVFQFPNLTTISIDRCESLKHVFTSSMVGSLLQLQHLSVSKCEHMEEVIVKDSNDGVEEEEESNAKTNQIITLPRLKSLVLDDLPRLKGFCLGKEDFSFPLLDTLEFRDCPAITTFTNGHSATPKPREIQINHDLFYVVGEDINSFIKINQEVLKESRLPDYV